MKPQNIVKLIDEKIKSEIDVTKFNERFAEQEKGRKLLKLASRKWDDIASDLEEELGEALDEEIEIEEEPEETEEDE